MSVMWSKLSIPFKSKKPTNGKKYFSILILGGSQGAEIFGKVIPSVINMLKTKIAQGLKDKESAATGE